MNIINVKLKMKANYYINVKLFYHNIQIKCFIQIINQ